MSSGDLEFAGRNRQGDHWYHGHDGSLRPESSYIVSIRKSLLDSFHLDLTLFEPRFIEHCIQARILANRCATIDRYSKLLSEQQQECSGLLRQLLSSPGWGLSLLAETDLDRCISLLLETRSRLQSEKTIRIWTVPAGLGLNAINLLLRIETSFLRVSKNDQAAGKFYQIYATDLDFELMRLAKKMAIPRNLANCLYSNDSGDDTLLVEHSDGLIRLRSDLRQNMKLTMMNHFHRPNLSRMDAIFIVDIFSRLSRLGAQRFLSTIETVIRPGGLILCYEEELAEYLVQTGRFESLDGSGLVRRLPFRDTFFTSSDSNLGQAKSQNSCLQSTSKGSELAQQSARPLTHERGALRTLGREDDYIGLLHREVDDLYSQIQELTEELSTSLEELETVNEELRISNDQLSTVNDEYSMKLEELSQYLKDYDRMTDSLNIAILFVANNRTIQFFNSRFESMFGLCAKDLNRSVEDFIFSQKLKLSEVLESTLIEPKEQEYPVDINGQRRCVRALPHELKHAKARGILFCIFEPVSSI